MCKLEVKINPKEKTYPIYITNKDISGIKQAVLEQINHKNYIVVISQKVYKLYSKILGFPKSHVFILKDGEKEKNINNYAKILDFASRMELKREDAIIAIGGGVVGDLAGFAASTYMRGINYIQVPTTLLACTDSSVGGKTAINSKYGKNLTGTFYQPKAVIINVNFLKTLDERQFKSGLGEVVKYGFIEKSCGLEEEPNLINFLTINQNKILERDILVLKDLIEICIKLKISVVNKDEQEAGLRRILNLGHTYAHAVENITKYRKYTHGECVAAGILYAFELACKLGEIDKEYKFLCNDLIQKFKFREIPKFNKDKMLRAILLDKKAMDNHIVFVLPNSYAGVKISKFTLEELKEIF